MKSHEEVLKQAFALALRSLRTRKGMTQEDLSLEGVSRAHLSDMENGRRFPKLDMLWHLCELLEIPLSTLAREIERNYAQLVDKRNRH